MSNGTFEPARARTRTRAHARARTFAGGMTAIDKEFCNANALSCGVIQNVLEKAPGLVFVNGAFRHKYSLVPPSPPPSPSAPPRLLAYAPRPPLPPPPPGTPPPYYAVRSREQKQHAPSAPRTARRTPHAPTPTPTQDAEPCLPLPRLTDYGLDITTDAVDGAETEERASCLFARRVLGARSNPSNARNAPTPCRRG